MLFSHLQDGPVNCNLALEHSLSKVAWEIHVIKINLPWSNADNCQNTRVSYITNSELTWNVADGVLVGWGSFTIYFPVLITGLDSKKPGNSCSGPLHTNCLPQCQQILLYQRLLKNTEMTEKVTVKVKSSTPPQAIEMGEIFVRDLCLSDKGTVQNDQYGLHVSSSTISYKALLLSNTASVLCKLKSIVEIKPV